MNRRDVLTSIAATAALAGTAQWSTAAVAGEGADGPFTLPDLGYGYDALEPHIDTTTMQIHHGAHHKGYVANANKLAAEVPQLGKLGIDEILSDLEQIPEASRNGVRNNVGGHYNHTLYWNIMTPGGSAAPEGDLKSAIDASFGDIDTMKAAVSKAGLGQFGSGWAWLALDKDKKLVVFSTANQDTPHMRPGKEKAILGVDVWEHAYYLKHMNKRAAYLDAWWNVVNWDKVAANFKAAAG